MPKATFAGVVSAFGAEAKAKLDNPAISGAPEDQLRAPLERLLHELAALGRPRAGRPVACRRNDALADADPAGLCRHRQQRACRLHRGQGAGQGLRPAQIRRPARQGAMGQAQVPAEPRLYRRQWLQPLARRRTGGKNRPARRRHRKRWREAESARDVARAYRRFPDLDPAAADQRQGARARPAPASAACYGTRCWRRWRPATAACRV